MSLSQMTVKERMIAAVNMQPVDRLPFWPKLSRSYPSARKGDYKNWTVPDFLKFIKCDVQQHIESCIKIKRTRTSFAESENGVITLCKYTTPYGTAEKMLQYDRTTSSNHPMVFPIKTAEDIKIMTAFYDDAEVILDQDILENNRAVYKNTGDSAMVAVSIGESPLMDFLENLAGIENGHYFLFDEKEAVEELFEAQQRYLCKTAAVLAEYSPADVFYMVENTSTTLISPKQYSDYSFKHIHEYGEILKSHDRILALHMCGHLKQLLPQLARSPAKMFEAFTSPTVGNTTLLDGRTACPDKCLFGGTNATLWIQPVEKIIEQIKNDLDALPHHRGLIVSSAGIMPPYCEPETIKEVCSFVQNYNISL